MGTYPWLFGLIRSVGYLVCHLLSQSINTNRYQAVFVLDVVSQIAGCMKPEIACVLRRLEESRGEARCRKRSVYEANAHIANKSSVQQTKGGVVRKQLEIRLNSVSTRNERRL